MRIKESVSDTDLEQIILMFRQYFSWITDDNGINMGIRVSNLNWIAFRVDFLSLKDVY